MGLKDRRKQIDAAFIDIAGEDHVYYQPPSNVQMKYPAIRYRPLRINSDHANNKPYKLDTIYEAIVIDKNPDSDIAEAVALLPGCSSNRFYIADNLNHWVFTIY